MLLPVVVLARRADLAEVIGAALAARAGGASCRAVAARLGRPVDTVRGWLRRFAARAEAVRVAFIVLLVDTGPDPLVPAATGSLFADAVAAIVGTAAAVAVAGGISGDRWEVAGPVLAMIADQHESPLPAGIVA